MMNDTYIEQLVSVKRTLKDIILYSAICIAAAAVAIVLLFFSMRIPLLVFLAAAAVYGAYLLIGKFGTEYEYIFTNGDLDIDKISGKQSRKRVISADCTETEKAGLLTDGIEKGKYDLVVTACDKKEDYKYYMIFRHKKAGRVLLIFSPNSELREAIKKSVPRHMQSGIFED